MNIYDLAVREDGRMVAVGFGGGVLSSLDSGEAWTRRGVRLEKLNTPLERVTYPAPEHIVAFSRGGTIVHSSDGGTIWTERVSGLHDFIYDIDFADEETGWIVGNRMILKTLDGGLSWSMDTTSVLHRLWAVDAVTPEIAYATGNDGVLFSTTDGGSTWKEILSDFTVQFTMVKVDGEGRITFGWLGGLVHSTDNGVTWSDNSAPKGSNLQHFSSLTPEYGWCGQHNAPLLITTDAGLT